MKLSILTSVLLLFVLLLPVTSQTCNATIGNYISPYSLGQQDELNDTLSVLCPSLSIKNIYYTESKANYTISNIITKCLFYDGAQKSSIGAERTIKVSGGKIQFQLTYNFSISKIGPDQLGYGYASVIVDAPAFTKKLAFTDQHNWILVDNSTDKLKFGSTFVIKRTTPNNITDDNKKLINFTINAAEGNAIEQITTQINAKIEETLNKTLKEQKVFNNTLIYKYQHPKNGTIEIKYENNMYKIILDATNGFILQYLSVVSGYSTKDCTSDIPNEPHPYNYYGGIQTVIHIDLITQTIQYLLDKKLLNTELNSIWDSNGFQFYAGDVFDVIPKVKQTIPPRTRLGGECIANGKILSFKRHSPSRYELKLTYTCSVMTETNIDILEFDVDVRFVLRMGLLYETLSVKIDDVDGVPTFKMVDGYAVDNLELAKFKIAQVLGSMKGESTFGTGFPTWPRDHPNVEVNENFTLLYDSSHVPHTSSGTKLERS